MSILCCRRGDPNTINKSVSLSPKIVGHITTPRPQAPRQNIEAFYNEGRELLNTLQEERGKSNLRNEIKEESKNFKRDINHILLTSSSTEETKNPSLPQMFPVNTPVIPKVDHIAVPSTPDLSPYLMPSIATTIASINGKSRSGITIPIPDDNSEAGKLSSEQSPDEKDAETADEWPEDCNTVKPEIRLVDKADEKDGTTADDGEVAAADPESPRNTKHREDASVSDKTASRNDFTPNEIFSKIPTWVRPSTSTFMSCPSSHDHNQKDGLGSSPSTGSATPELTKSNSTRFYSPLEATSANSTGVNTPAFACPPTPGYEFRPSIDNTSSFYPSPGTSRCVSLVESERCTPEPSALSTDADAHRLNRTPRPSDMIIDSPGGSLFKFPWVSLSMNKSPEPITNEAAFTRGSSLAHLKKAQKRGRDLQLAPRTNIERSQDVVLSQHGEVCEDLYLEDRAKSMLEAPESLPNVPIDKASWYYDNLEDREISNSITTPAPKKKEKSTTWVRSTTRVSSLTMRQGKVKDPRIWGSPHGSEVLPNLTTDIETLDETEARNSRLKNRRSKAMIRSRSMTLRRTFTNSIAKLRGKNKFGISGSDVSSIIFRPSLPKEMLEHQSSTELIKKIPPRDEDIVTKNETVESYTESSYHGVHSHRIPDDRSVPDNPGLKNMIEESNREGSEDAESDSDIDTQSSGPFRVGGRNTEEIWRDAKESLESTA
ncbi:hypothetical protein P167DRAFT_547384 [Morchella conica CCBAS932]|uniref:Uncharacterized protein n=1 Tax=Morchella conica CCBAS932 TaxID=1392247 RepID=A0A3N4KID1_9PEZI|nr:hypothetical protein P167DRAFT_547384 [Morchella conica CCBAS932]